jgi:hypothetical protein
VEPLSGFLLANIRIRLGLHIVTNTLADDGTILFTILKRLKIWTLGESVINFLY